MNSFKQYHLDTKAYDYFKERLDQGLTLTTYLKKIDLKKGQIVTFAPDNLSKEHLLNFNSSIVFGEPISENKVQKVDNNLTSKWLVKQIKYFLAQSRNNYCICEEADDFPQKGIITRFPFRNVLYKDGEPYYILDCNDSEETILEAVRQNTAYFPLGMGVFTTIENMSSYFSNKDYINNNEFFKIVAKNTQKIYIQAYDHEGYVLWEKSK